MSKAVLFVCQSCRVSSESDQADQAQMQPCENSQAGANLLRQLQQLQTQHQSCPHLADLDIQAAGCLWTCDRPCAVAFCAPGKPTYLFSAVAETAAPALLQMADLYLTRATGQIPWPQIPAALQSVDAARIPPLVAASVALESSTPDAIAPLPLDPALEASPPV
ncbi:DUF1636 family protein [Lyngbya confervoides]|uniref:DUF1636 domain-containing protein n=1 Tax=Lyngbya confervoides BDU141951 TaxID=1574623 RepID=A0ABD4T2X4_9CYAN|nr:DUF1636 domain-containing protein [Lyngbya confervoides]MCM1982897.1 DUF1636 domain-containing protein [Lyngbya confervoides BDU141951]